MFLSGALNFSDQSFLLILSFEFLLSAAKNLIWNFDFVLIWSFEFLLSGAKTFTYLELWYFLTWSFECFLSRTLDFFSYLEL